MITDVISLIFILPGAFMVLSAAVGAVRFRSPGGDVHATRNASGLRDAYLARLADKGVMQALAGSIGALLVTLALGRWAFGQAGVAMSYVVLLGTVAFATVAPVQMRVLQQAGAAGA